MKAVIHTKSVHTESNPVIIKTLAYGMALGFVLVGSACQDNLSIPESPPGKVSTLQIEVNNQVLQGQTTKGLVTEAIFPSESALGLTLLDAGESNYDGKTYRNVKYTFTGTKWVSEKEVLLTAAEGTVYGYYPYSNTVTDITTVPIDATQDIDYMYVANKPTVTAEHYTATLTMKHALTAIEVTLDKGTYTQTGTVTRFVWNSPSAAKTGLLNAKNGAINIQSGKNEVFDTGVTEQHPISIFDNARYTFLAIPTGETSALGFTILLDGQTFSAQTSPITLEPGAKHQYTLKVNGTQLELSQVNITDWAGSDQPTLKPGL